jgi:hypothetical protein
VLQVGSFGRNTGIDGISDLDMLYIMPKKEWDTYKDGKQLKLLQDVKAAVLARYPQTDVRVDRLVVTVTYTDFHVEIQPVFGEEAQKRDCIRGDVVDDEGHNEKTETTNFKGDHVVECYAVKDGIVVAKDRIHVPISTNA